MRHQNLIKKESFIRNAAWKQKAILGKLKVIIIAGGFLMIVGGLGYLYHTQTIADAFMSQYNFSDGQAGRIGDEAVSMGEFSLYSVDVRAGYEEIYGNEIWSTTTTDALGNEATFEEIAKEDVFEQIRLIKSLCKEAEALNISISEEEETAVKNAALTYYMNLDAAGATAYGVITYDIVLNYYRQAYVAQKVYNYYAKNSDTQDDDTALSDEDLASLWATIIQKYYPSFDYKLDINWDLVNNISYGSIDSNNKTEGETQLEE